MKQSRNNAQMSWQDAEQKFSVETQKTFPQ
jgi:hypothetical protein